MGYLTLGQLGYGYNPFINGSNPFANYSNPCFGSNFGSSLFQQPQINFGAYGYLPSSYEYNFLNKPAVSAPLSTSGFGSYTPLFNTFGSNSLGGFGSFGNYNFLSSNFSTPITPSFNNINYAQQINNPYSFTNWGNYQNIYTQPQTSDTPQSETPETVKEQTISGKQNYGPEFLAKVKRISNNLNCNYKDLLAVMNAESGIKTTAVNKSTNATGLIQFMPKTAQDLGTSVDELKKMTPVQQLDYVEKYLQKAKKQVGFSSDRKISGGELYALVFRPAKTKTGIFATKGETAYNSGENYKLDLNKDGKKNRPF